MEGIGSNAAGKKSANISAIPDSRYECVRIGVVFSSGFFGFFAHAGFLSALRHRKIKPDAYAGASSGAIVAAMAASGMTDSEIKQLLLNLRKEDFWDPDSWLYIIRKAIGFFRGYLGYLKGNGFAELLKKLPTQKIEDCPYPLAIAATNLTTKKETIFTYGSMVKALRASGAVPVLFKPVEIDGAYYVDGGVVSKAPLTALADHVKLDKIIVHYITSDNIRTGNNMFLSKRWSPWHIEHLAFNIGRKASYHHQLEILRMRGIDVIEVNTHTPSVGPDRLDKGLEAYESAKKATLTIL